MGIKCCKDCPDRHVGCHGTCERYKAERAEMDRLKERMKNDDDFHRYKQEKIVKRIVAGQKRDQRKMCGCYRHYRRNYD